MNDDRLHQVAQSLAGVAERRRTRRDILTGLAAGGIAALATGGGVGRERTVLASAAARGVAGTPVGGQPQPITVMANGVELTYVEQGQGEPVILVHGSLNDFRSWGFQLPTFAQHYRTVAYSRRDHWPNATQGNAENYDPSMHADDLAALIETLGPGPAHLVGSSHGALTMLLVAARRPELVRTLVLGEPPLLLWLNGVSGGSALLKAFMASAWEPARQALEQGDLEEGVRLFLDGTLGPGAFDQLPPPVRAMMLDNAPTLRQETATPPETYFSALTCEEASGIRAPALLLTGEFTPAIFRLVNDELAGCLAASERATIPGASHAHHAGNPPVYNETVLGFLASH